MTKCGITPRLERFRNMAKCDRMTYVVCAYCLAELEDLCEGFYLEGWTMICMTESNEIYTVVFENLSRQPHKGESE